ncbi:MAG TPA: zf-HC2 domain-containing protein [Anaeromyxobacteraceae bacterium]|jgi:anti-sigma factor RsiW|nr:zf-HC2 domain-containing protein [Anaeromyxobacteraceae bacterium]
MNVIHLDDQAAQLFADGALAPGPRAEAERHAASCAECAALIESYRALGAALEAGLGAPSPPAGFTAGVMDLIDAAEAARAFERRLALGILAVAAAAAAALFVLAGAAAWAPALSRGGALLADLAEAARLGGDVLSPLVRALRLQLAVAAAVAVLVLSALLRPLVPVRARARAG